MPIELQQSGYMVGVSYFKRSVNVKGENFSEIFNEINKYNADFPC